MLARPLAFVATSATCRPSGETARDPVAPTVSAVGSASVHPSGALIEKLAVRVSIRPDFKTAAATSATTRDNAATVHANQTCRRELFFDSTKPAARAGLASHLSSRARSAALGHGSSRPF